MLKNENGSILVVTAGFVLVFSLLGVASIYFAGLQNELAEKRKYSMEAFWLADGAIERAREKLPGLIAVAGEELGHGTYDAASAVVLNSISTWILNTTGNVSGEERSIEAVVRAFNFPNLITTRGPVEIDPTIGVDDTLVKENVNFELEQVFDGISQADIEAMADHTFTDPGDGTIGTVSGVTVIHVVGSSSVEIPSNNFQGNNLLFIDTTQSTAELPQIDFVPGTFNGIVYVVGDAEITGTPIVVGNIFIQGDPSKEVKITGNGEIVYNLPNIESVANDIGSPIPSKPKIVSWREI